MRNRCSRRAAINRSKAGLDKRTEHEYPSGAQTTGASRGARRRKREGGEEPYTTWRKCSSPMSKTERIATVAKTVGVNVGSPAPRERPAATGAELDYRGRRSRTLRKGPRVGAAAQPIDVVDWLLVKDIVDLTWEIQRARLQRERLVRTERVASLRTVIFSILDPGSNPVRATIDATACRIAEKWGRGDTKGIKRVDELLAQAGLSMADVDLQSLSTKSSELERLDERDERLAKRRDEICGKSSGGARAGRSWCGTRARKLSKGNSMNCRRAHQTSTLGPTCPTGGYGRRRLSRARADRQETSPRAKRWRLTIDEQGPIASTRREAPDRALRRAKPLRGSTHCVMDSPRRHTTSQAQTRRSRRWRVRLQARKMDPSCWPWRGGLRMPSCAYAVSRARKWSSRMRHGLLRTSEPIYWEWFTPPRPTPSLRWGAWVKTLRRALSTAMKGAHGHGANLRSAITTPPGRYWRPANDHRKLSLQSEWRLRRVNGDCDLKQPINVVCSFWPNEPNGPQPSPRRSQIGLIPVRVD